MAGVSGVGDSAGIDVGERSAPGAGGIPVGSITDAKINATSRVKVVTNAPLNPMYPEYGAKFDGTTDDAAAINACIAALPVTGNDETTGGVIVMPPGDCKIGSTLSVSTLKNITLRGNGSRYGGTRLLYTGTATAINAKSAGGFTLEQIAVANTSASYAGTLIDISGTNVNPSNFASLRDVRLDMAQAAAIACVGVDANFAINPALEHCYITGGGKGIYGCRTSSDFCNVALLRKVYFANQDTIAVHNLGANGAGAIIESCTFEPLRSGAAGAYLQDSTVPFGGLLLWTNNYAGDGNGSGTWITFNGNALEVLANFGDAANIILLNGETRSLAVGGWISQTAGHGGINFNGQTVRSYRDLGLHGSGAPHFTGTSVNFGSGGGMASGSVAVQVVKTATQAITTSTATAVSWDALGFDTLSQSGVQWTSGNPTRLVCKVPGVYRVSATIVWAANATGERAAWFKVNGSTFIQGFRGAPDPNGTAPTATQGFADVILNAGDYVECFVQQASGGNLNVTVSDGGIGIPTAFSIVRVG